jgi:FtsP/CotA-like multicopper oxidase with cupredoxin domain
MRAIPQDACSDNAYPDNIMGIVYYGDSPSTPTTAGYAYDDACDDETANLVPHLSMTADGATALWTEDSEATVAKANGLFKWYLNSTTMVVDWGSPSLQRIAANDTASFSASNAVFELADADEWVVFVVETTMRVPHPIHLHGHDFFVLAQGSGAYDAGTVALATANPPRRDTAMLPSAGYLVMAWQTDNPGAWLMHCHIGWHTSEGFAVQFLERMDEIPALVDAESLDGTCSAWNAFQASAGVEQDDSGV